MLTNWREPNSEVGQLRSVLSMRYPVFSRCGGQSIDDAFTRHLHKGAFLIRSGAARSPA